MRYRRHLIMNNEIKNIVFDFGGVLVNLDKQRTIDRFQQLGCDVQGCIRDYVQQGPFARLEIGLIGKEEFYSEIRMLCTREKDQSITSTQIDEAWNTMLVDVPRRRLQALLKLRKRYRLFLLSNTNRIHREYSCKEFFLSNDYSVNDYFERIYLSYELGLMKPDTAIFKTLLEQEGLIAQETLFIDDSPANCEAAALLGLHTCCPKEADDWLPLFL